MFFINIKCLCFYSTFIIAVFKSLSNKYDITVFVVSLLRLLFPLRLSHIHFPYYLHKEKDFNLGCFECPTMEIWRSEFFPISVNNANFLWLMIRWAIDLFFTQAANFACGVTINSSALVSYSLNRAWLHLACALLPGHLVICTTFMYRFYSILWFCLLK